MSIFFFWQTHDISAVADTSLMAPPLSKSLALVSSQEEEVCGEVQTLYCRSSSAPILKLKTRPPPLTPRSLSPHLVSIDTFESLSSPKPSSHLASSKMTSKAEVRHIATHDTSTKWSCFLLQTHNNDFSKHSIFSLNNTALTQSIVLSDTDLYGMQREASKGQIPHRSSSAPNLKASQTIGTSLFKFDGTLQQ